MWSSGKPRFAPSGRSINAIPTSLGCSSCNNHRHLSLTLSAQSLTKWQKVNSQLEDGRSSNMPHLPNQRCLPLPRASPGPCGGKLAKRPRSVDPSIRHTQFWLNPRTPSTLVYGRFPGKRPIKHAPYSPYPQQGRWPRQISLACYEVWMLKKAYILAMSANISPVGDLQPAPIAQYAGVLRSLQAHAWPADP